MTTQIVPLVAKPAQKLTIGLAGQNCQIAVYQKAQGLFLDLVADDATIVRGVVAENGNRLVRYAYLGFVGDLVFFDTQGADDPDFSGLGSRWLLGYLTVDQLAAMGYDA